MREAAITTFEHPRRPGNVSVPHPQKDLPIGTYRSILKQAGIL
ncbi:type II toxin-antitoxin system HicA family toxin [uncultured Fretibacterium sp.]